MGVSRRVFRARRGRRRAGSPRGADAEAKASGSIHLAAAMSGGARKSSERAAPRAAATDNGSVCHCPARESGIRVPLDYPQFWKWLSSLRRAVRGFRGFRGLMF